MTDILIKNGTIATMDQQANVYQNGSLYVKDGRIVAVGEQVDVSGRSRITSLMRNTRSSSPALSMPTPTSSSTFGASMS